MKGWITVADAALLARRTPATIYNWIAQGRLHTHVGTGSITLVQGRAVLDVEAEIKMGRPEGSARTRRWG